MIQAKKTWYDDAGVKQTDDIPVSDHNQAWRLALDVWEGLSHAYCVTMDRFGNGAFVARVMSKEKMIFKIEHHVA